MSSSPSKENSPRTRSSAATNQVYSKRKLNSENPVAASKKAKLIPEKKKKVVPAATAPVEKDAEIAPAAVEKVAEDAIAIVDAKKKTVPRVKKAPLVARAADKLINDDESKFASTSRPQTLAELAKELSNEQKEALEKIGFQSLLKIKIDKLPTQMLGWLVKQFNGTSRMLRINQAKAFVITPADIRDVLLLPMHSGHRVEVFKKNDDVTAVKEFKTRCGIGESISVAKLRQILLSEPYQKGGEDFLRMYVLLSLSSFLAPTANTGVDFAPLKALLDVEKISKLDWCSFVLDRLCKVVNKYNQGLVTKVSGCVLALQIIYLHRMKWKGRAEPNDLPLIQHWTTETMRERIKEESVAGEYGQGEWVEHTYPVSRNEPEAKVDLNILLDAVALEDACEEEASAPTSDNVCIRFTLPPGVPTDAEIKKQSADPVQEMFLLLKRDMCIVSEHYMERLKKMKDRVPPPPPPGAVCKKPPVSSASVDEKCSAIEEFLRANEKLWADENVYRVLDKSIANHNLMKGLSAEPPTFHLLSPELRSPECTPPQIDVDILSGGVDAALKSAGAHDRNRPDQSVYGPVSSEICIAAETTGFLSSFMTGNKRLLLGLDARDKQVLDCCFFDADSFYDKSELFFQNNNLFVSKNDILTLNTRRWVISNVVDTWVLILNNLEGSDTERLFLDTTHSYYVEKIFKTDGKVEDHERSMRACWGSFVAESGKVLNSAEIVFVPVFWEQHYFCVVINCRAGKIQFLDNREESDAMEYMAIVNLIHKQMSIFLEEKNHPKGKLVHDFVVEFIKFPWQSSDEVNDCGVFLMHHMEHFKGEPYESEDDMTKAMVRRVLRAKFCLRIVLSDLNELRSSVINKAYDFCKSKVDLKIKMDEKKKADAFEKRKEAADKKKQAAEKAKKAAEKRKAEKKAN